MRLTKPPVHIFLIRHGLREDMLHPDWKTTAARPDDTPISGEGVRQAEDIAEILEKAGVQALYSSPFLRAVQTAAATSNRMNLPVRIEPGFAEFISPEWFEQIPALLSLEELQKECPRIDPTYQAVIGELTFEDGEAADLRQRVDKSLQHILAWRPNETLAIFTHGAPLCQAVSLLIDTLENIDTGMAAITQVECLEGKFRLISSSSAHLRDKDHIRRFHESERPR